MEPNIIQVGILACVGVLFIVIWMLHARTRAKDQADLALPDSALRDAIRHRDAARVEALLDEGADLTIVDSKGITSLMIAAWTGAQEIVELLLKAGADPTPKDKHGYTAEMFALWQGEYRMGAYTAESLKIAEMLRRAQS